MSGSWESARARAAGRAQLSAIVALMALDACKLIQRLAEPVSGYHGTWPQIDLSLPSNCSAVVTASDVWTCSAHKHVKNMQLAWLGWLSLIAQMIYGRN